MRTKMLKEGIVVHGGAGAPPSMSDGCEAAVKAGLKVFGKGKPALDAAIAAVISMEDDGRFNAGSGSVLRLDGKSIEMDAGVMDSKGILGAVASVHHVRNPVVLARRVAETPHIFLAGDGAVAFARACGLYTRQQRPTAQSRRYHKRLLEALRNKKADMLRPDWLNFDLQRYWNLKTPYERIFEKTDTVGAVALSADGVFAVAGSTGGAAPMLRGRIGDTPIIGSGFYAGPHGAVAATGIGEEIMRRTLSLQVYTWIAEGLSPQAACERGVKLMPKKMPAGLIAIGKRGYGIAANVPMACHVVVE